MWQGREGRGVSCGKGGRRGEGGEREGKRNVPRSVAVAESHVLVLGFGARDEDAQEREEHRQGEVVVGKHRRVGIRCGIEDKKGDRMGRVESRVESGRGAS